MPIFKALVITEHKQKTPLTIIDYEEPTLGEGEFLLENVAVAQVRIKRSKIHIGSSASFLTGSEDNCLLIPRTQLIGNKLTGISESQVFRGLLVVMEQEPFTRSARELRSSK